ncbi:FeoB-associated Cys-rich membrane protein [Christensenella minuta]|nr:FeoB-associated Cys-rich membrane protein [Christensenella minuta]
MSGPGENQEGRYGGNKGGVKVNPGTILVVVIVAACFGLSIWGLIRQQKKGGCCGSCKGCSHSSSCHTGSTHKV